MYLNWQCRFGGTGIPPTVLNSSNPALGGGIDGYGETPPTASISSASVTVAGFITCIILPLSTILQWRLWVRNAYKFWAVQFFAGYTITQKFLVPFYFYSMCIPTTSSSAYTRWYNNVYINFLDRLICILCNNGRSLQYTYKMNNYIIDICP